MNRDQIIVAFFFALLLIVLYQLFLIFSPFFRAIFWAGLLAFIFYPMYQQLLKLLGNRPNLAAVISSLIVLVIVIPFAGIIIYSVTVEGIKLYDLASQTFTVEKIKEFIAYSRSFELIDSAFNKVLQSEDLQRNLNSFILNAAKSIGNYATGLLASATKNILLIVIHLLLVIFVLFFFFKDGGNILEEIKNLLPMDRKHKNAIYNKISETLSAVVRGQFVTAFIQASIASIVYWLLGLPIPLFFGFLTFLSSMIPVLGAASVWVPFVIYLLAIQSYGKAIILLLIGTFCISLLDNFLKPYLIGEKTKLPILLLFFGILGGLRLYGLTGIFLGPVILALFFALLKIYQTEYMSLKK